MENKPKPKAYVGIDNGLDGAVAVISDGDVEVFDAPVSQTGKGSRRTYRVRKMADIVRDIMGRCDAIFAAETASTRPGQSAQSGLKTGFGAGLWVGVMSALGARYTIVRPQEWMATVLKGREGKNGGKEGKKKTALWVEEVYPSVEVYTQRGRLLDGRADAVGIAEWMRRTYGVNGGEL